MRARIFVYTWLFGCLAALAAVAIAAAPAFAEEEPEWDGDGIVEAGEDETAELARAAQNPVANLISFPIQNNTNFNWGPGDIEETQNVMNIQPVWPFSITDDWNLITRTILPVTSQPGRFDGEDRQTGTGDLLFTTFLSPAKASKVLWGVGPAVMMPTASHDRLGADKWGLGPSVVVIGMPGNWVIGTLINNIWSVGGKGLSYVFVDILPHLAGKQAKLLAAAVYVGWALGAFGEVSDPVYALAFAFLAGGIMIVTTIFELPQIRS